MEEKRLKIEPKQQAPEKMSYEQLENVAHQMSEQSRNLYNQNQQLAKRLEESNLQNFFRRLEYLWTIINSNTPYITEEFKVNCGQEFMDAMSIAEEKEEQKEE